MNNVRIAIRDSTDSHNVAFFDNVSGIRYQSANLQRFLAGSASILTIEYNSKDIDTIRTGCKLAFVYKERAYWLNIMDLSKKGYKVEITAYSLGLELNQEERGAHKPANAMSFAEYLAYYDPEHALEIGVNEVADKRIKLEWTGTDTILARLFSIANSFDAELEFTVELNQDYSLKRQVLNIYKKGNLGSNRAASPIRVGRSLKVINYSDNLKELRTAVRATGKDGLTIDGLNKKVYDDDGNLLYYSSGMTVYAPQSRDKYPSVGKKSNDNWIIKELGETEYSTKEALWGYMLGELKKICVPQITYDVEGAVDGDVGDTRTLIDDVHYDPPLYVQARISELTEDLITGKVTKSTLTNFERKYSQVASELLKQVEQLANDAAPYIIRLETNNGFNFKNGKGSSTVTASLEKYGKIVNANWKWLINNSVVSETSSVKINASQVNGTLNVVAVAIVGGNEAAREYITFTNVNDGPQGPQGPQGDEGPKGDKGDTGNGIANTVVTYGLSVSDTTEPATWSSSVPTLVKGMYLWTRTVYIYTNGESTTSYQISYIAKDADATAAIDKTKQELLEKLDTVRNDSLAAADEAKQELATVSDDLSKAKTDLQNAVSAVDTKATNLQSDLTKAKQDLTSQAQQLQAQANAQSELTKRVSTVEETANGTKTTVSELSKTVAQNGKDITSVTTRTKTVEDDLSGTKTTLSQVQTTANSASQKTAALETGLNGLGAKFETLKIGSRNYFKNSKSRKYYIDDRGTQDVRTYIDDEFWQNDTRFTKDYVRMSFDIAFNPALSADFTTNVHFSANPWYNCGGITFKGGTTALQHFDLKFDLSGAGNSYKTDNVFIRLNNTLPLNTAVSLENFNLYLSAVVEDYSQNEADIEQKVADYKQDADRNYASLQSTVQALDGTVTQNKTSQEQTASELKSRLTSLETYKDGEATRAKQYFEANKTETAKQITAERTATAQNYLAKSTYQEDYTGVTRRLTATETVANGAKTNADKAQTTANTAVSKADAAQVSANNANSGVTTVTNKLATYQTTNDKRVASLEEKSKTTDGKLVSLSNTLTQTAKETKESISSVEAKIPTTIGGQNLFKGTRNFDGSAWNYNPQSKTIASWKHDDFTVLKASHVWDGISQLIQVKTGETYTFSFGVASSVNNDTAAIFITLNDYRTEQKATVDIASKQLTAHQYWTRQSITFTVLSDGYIAPRVERRDTNATLYLAAFKLERSSIASDWSPAYEDTMTEISNAKLAITKNAEGLKLVASKASSNESTLSTHTTQISALNTGLNAKVSQTDFNTLSGRVTTAENNITAKANELSSKITSVEGKIPSGEMNLVEYGRPADGYSPYADVEYTTHPFYYNSAYKMYIIKNTTTSEKMLGMNRFKVERNTDYTLYFKGFNNSAITHMDVWFLKRVSGSIKDFDSAQILVSGRKLSISKAEDVSVTFNTGNYDEGYIRFDNNGSITAGTQADLYFGDVSVKKGKSNNGWSPSQAELASSQDLKNAQSELKQTTDSIKASVSSLDKSTVKSSSLTINTDGIVMKAGKSTTDVANAIGSYFAVNQNAINLFADKIKVKGDMIVDGAITADKFKAARITSLNGATTFDLDSGNITFKKNLATINQVNGNYKSEVSLSSIKASIPAGDWSSVSTIAMDSTSFNTSKRRAGMRVDMMPTYSTTLITGETISFAGETESLGTVANSVSVTTEAAHLDVINKDTKGPSGQWNYPMIMDFGINAAIRVPDIKLGGYTKSLKGILNDLCRKTGILWT